ncbi:MAG: 2OG-Fe(II) oxygenase [Undibacterium sp.]|nr:2OG-Fe(II) oxygenase [Undibacterium sp.]
MRTQKLNSLSEENHEHDRFNVALQDDISRNLSQHGWSQADNFLPQELCLSLAQECLHLHAQGQMRLAQVGSAKTRTLQSDIRRDQIAWLQNGQSAACDRYLAIMENLRLHLNRDCFLGLEDYESHFALYRPGAFYRAHVDRFRDDDRRTVSVVIYLNQDWRGEHGGALRLYPEGQSVQDISPEACRLVVFMSADILHEVLPATRDRLSLAGWFRRRV